MKRLDCFCHNNIEYQILGDSEDEDYMLQVAEYVAAFGPTHAEIYQVNIGPHAGIITYVHFKLNPILEKMLNL